MGLVLVSWLSAEFLKWGLEIAVSVLILLILFAIFSIDNYWQTRWQKEAERAVIADD
jgi:hypothetical protein